MRALFFGAALGFLSVTALAPVGRAQNYARPEAVGNLVGTVLDAHGKPVADASVTIQTSDGLQPHATHTDSKGHFEFNRWATGQYDLRAYSKGVFSNWDQREVIRAKKTTEVTLRLEAE